MTCNNAETGKPCEVEGVSTLRLRDGKVCEEVDCYTPAPIHGAANP